MHKNISWNVHESYFLYCFHAFELFHVNFIVYFLIPYSYMITMYFNSCIFQTRFMLNNISWNSHESYFNTIFLLFSCIQTSSCKFHSIVFIPYSCMIYFVLHFMYIPYIVDITWKQFHGYFHTNNHISYPFHW